MDSVSERIQGFRQRAEHIRRVAITLIDEECREALRRLADGYDRMADRQENGERENESA